MSKLVNLIILSKKTALFGVGVTEIRSENQVRRKGKIKRGGLSFGVIGVMIDNKTTVY